MRLGEVLSKAIGLMGEVSDRVKMTMEANIEYASNKLKVLGGDMLEGAGMGCGFVEFPTLTLQQLSR